MANNVAKEFRVDFSFLLFQPPFLGLCFVFQHFTVQIRPNASAELLEICHYNAESTAKTKTPDRHHNLQIIYSPSQRTRDLISNNMSYWDQKARLTVQDSQGSTIAVKNRFPRTQHETQSLATILERVRTGEVRYDSLEVIIRGVDRSDVPMLITGGNETASERDLPHTNT